MVKSSKVIAKLTTIAMIFAFVVIGLGAYTRLTDSGLGCPDWPGCYGHVTAPIDSQAIAIANADYPGMPVNSAKAFREMVHRYVAAALGIIILILAFSGFANAKQISSTTLALCMALVGLVFYQAILGMWTVAWQLLPLVVMGHLLGGMTILGTLWIIQLRNRKTVPVTTHAPAVKFRSWALFGLMLVVIQLALGGWTSANYASLVCPDFPTCHGVLFPTLNFHEAFNISPPVGMNYEGGHLGLSALITIQMLHRFGAFILFTYLSILSITMMIKVQSEKLKQNAKYTFLMLVVQLSLGALNVVMKLPLLVAVLHNLGAAILLLLVISMNFHLYQQPCEEVGDYALL